MSEENRILQMDSIDDIMQRYIQVKLSYLQKRKDHLIDTISNDIRYMVSKYIFIKSIVEETLVITKRPTQDIINDLNKMDKIIKKEDNYDYLLNMPIKQLTQEQMDRLLKQIKEQKIELDKIKKTSINELWLEELR